MISSSSTFASSAPATSAKVTWGVSGLIIRAFERPNWNARFPPLCMARKIQIQKAMKRKTGRMEIIRVPQPSPRERAVISTSLSRMSPTSSAVTSAAGSSVTNSFTSVSSTVIVFLSSPSTRVSPWKVTSRTLSFSIWRYSSETVISPAVRSSPRMNWKISTDMSAKRNQTDAARDTRFSFGSFWGVFCCSDICLSANQIEPI